MPTDRWYDSLISDAACEEPALSPSDKADKSYSAQDVCDVMQISKSTLFKWEREGKISTVERDWRGWRVYRERNLAEIRAIMEQQPPSPAKNNLVLVVDDEPEIRRVLSEVLSTDGYEVISAQNGQEAVEMHAEYAPGLILMDVKMDVMDGIEAFKAIKRVDRKVPIILLTAYPDIRDAVEAVKMGAFNYLTKPFDIGDVRAMAKEILG